MSDLNYSSLRPAGYFQVSGENGVQRGETMQCKHCSAHFPITPGSGKRRGWCMGCNGPTCGKANCDVCVHWEQRLENTEQGRPELYKPVKVSVPDVPKSHLKGGIVLSE